MGGGRSAAGGWVDYWSLSFLSWAWILVGMFGTGSPVMTDFSTDTTLSKADFVWRTSTILPMNISSEFGCSGVLALLSDLGFFQ